MKPFKNRRKNMWWSVNFMKSIFKCQELYFKEKVDERLGCFKVCALIVTKYHFGPNISLIFPLRMPFQNTYLSYMHNLTCKYFVFVSPQVWAYFVPCASCTDFPHEWYESAHGCYNKLKVKTEKQIPKPTFTTMPSKI